MTVNTTSHGTPEVPAVFPDWSPYRDLVAACRAYLRDPDLALEALDGALDGGQVAGFTLERFVNDANGVWQEVAVCDSSRLVLWHGEDLAADDGPPGAMSSSLRVIPLASVTEVGCRRRLLREPDGSLRVDSVDVYVLLTALDEGVPGGLGDPTGGLRHDALRFGKTFDEGGPGQIARVEEFATLVASLVGRPAS
jgi:hypothetical protein